MNKVRLAFACAALMSVALLAGCGGGGGGGSTGGGGGGVTNPTGNPTPNNAPGVHLDFTALTMNTGTTQTITAVLDDSSGNIIVTPDANWQWSVDNPSIVTITPTGHTLLVASAAVGTATVTAKETGSGQTATCVITVIANTGGGATGGGNNTGGVTSGVTTGGATTGGATTGGATTSGATTGSATTGGATTGGSTGASSLPSIDGTLFYQTNFPSAIGPEWSQTDASLRTQTPTGRWFYGQFGKQNPDVSLTLTGIPAHSTISVGFTLFIIRSMDGNETANGFGPDIWDLSVDGGPTLLHTTFSNNSTALLAGQSQFPEGFSQSYPATYDPSHVVNNPYWSGAQEINNLGFQFFSKPADTVYQIVRTFSHSSPNLKLNFTSSDTQGIDDESWGLEKVVVYYQ